MTSIESIKELRIEFSHYDHPYDKKLLVNISVNKYSSHPRELYSARRAAIRYFEQNQPENFDLYGIGWNRPVNILEKLLPITRQIYSSYRGTVKNKWDVLTQYRYQNAIRRYLASERFEKFLPPNFADTIINALKL